MTDCPACKRAFELGMQPALCGDHINAWKVEEACRRWWDVKRADGSRIATVGWDEFAEKHPDHIADYRTRMAAALEIKL